MAARKLAYASQSMSGNTSDGAAAKRQRLQLTARPKVPLPLLAVVKSFLDTLVVTRPFAGAPVYGIMLTHAERLRVVDCGSRVSL